MMNNPLISIVIPCYNSEATVAQAIDSCLAQDYPHVEVIVVNDGSTDNTLEVLSAYSRLVHIISGTNQGGCIARNKGIDAAKGEFVQFLDADDVLYASKIRRHVESRGEVRESIYYSNYKLSDMESGEALGVQRVDPAGRSSMQVVLEGGDIQTSSPLYPRSLLEEIGGFRPHLDCAQEYDLNIRLAGRGVRFLHLDECLHEVRRRNSSVSSNYVKVLSRMIWVYKKVESELRGCNLWRHEYDQLFAVALAKCGRALIRQGESARGETALSDAKELGGIGAVRLAYGQASWLLRCCVGAGIAERLIRFMRCNG